jgi:hypothetical protein
LKKEQPAGKERERKREREESIRVGGGEIEK